jgi:hypothetical protein
MIEETSLERPVIESFVLRGHQVLRYKAPYSLRHLEMRLANDVVR